MTEDQLKDDNFSTAKNSCLNNNLDVDYPIVDENRCLELNYSENSAYLVPDGGWGWLIVMASLCCIMMVDGICSSYGFLINPYCESHYRTRTQNGTKFFPELCIGTSELGEILGTQSRCLLMLPAGFISGFHLLLGPFVSSLSTELDFRTVCFVGVTVSSLSIFLANYATSYLLFLFAYGIFGGIGFSLVYLPAITIISDWFLNKRSLAVGIAFCGSGLGYILSCQIASRLIPSLTCLTFLNVLAAFCLQCLILVTLFRPLEKHQHILNLSRVRRDERRNKQRAKLEQREFRRRQILEAKAKKEAIEKQRKQRKKLETEKIKTKASENQTTSGNKNVHPKGGIMDRIIEEKRRQRKTSLGSLDGMVITLGNELISSRKYPEQYANESLISAAAISRITSAVMRNLESQRFPTSTSTQNNSFLLPGSKIDNFDSQSAGTRSHKTSVVIPTKAVITEDARSRLSNCASRPDSLNSTSTRALSFVGVSPAASGVPSNSITSRNAKKSFVVNTGSQIVKVDLQKLIQEYVKSQLSIQRPIQPIGTVSETPSRGASNSVCPVLPLIERRRKNNSMSAMFGYDRNMMDQLKQVIANTEGTALLQSSATNQDLENVNNISRKHSIKSQPGGFIIQSSILTKLVNGPDIVDSNKMAGTENSDIDPKVSLEGQSLLDRLDAIQFSGNERDSIVSPFQNS